ncbi:SGNH/GDSL hydrolase family protein [Rufibacter roseus]|uniref:SGNH/GDSL hydrolase family protein n=1 Tax=Rufibacter roseus TaxID=1567108 RepID=A0ABW2DHC8_9BACT|nr:SGNH/GDSL hydrolase family protein [Rufibacter roseus]
MKHTTSIQILLAFLLFAYSATEGKQKEAQVNVKAAASPEKIEWHPVNKFGIRGLGWQELQETFTRLPAKAQGVVSPAVWKLSQHSAGLYVQFATNSTTIKVKWSVRANNSFSHMAPTVVKGVDLYAREGQNWRWVGVGKPSGKKNEDEIATNLPSGQKEFMLYLPLYDGVDSVAIGVENGSTISGLTEPQKKPIVFYGTSITQGACASRPGMAYPAIIGRCLNRETVNLGFSGNGKMDEGMANLLTELDPALFVLDCLPNLQPEEVLPRTLAVVRMLRAAKPNTPILLVENINYAHSWANQRVSNLVQTKNKHLQQAYKELQSEGVKNLFYLDNKNLMVSSGEGTVDGIHLTDLGFAHLANELAKEIKRIDKKVKLP